jgi:hypothetical protein
VSREQWVLISLIVLHLLWVLLPLVPAVLIYSWFPDTSVAVNGPLAQLTVRASGAFAAYLIVFVSSFGFVHWLGGKFGGFQHPSWTLNGEVRLVDKNGKPLTSPALLEKLNLKTRPEIFSSASENENSRIRMRIPEENNEFPLIVLEIENFGRKVLDLSSATIEKSEFEKTLKIVEPITIKERPSITQVPASGAVLTIDSK